jgi:cytochrome c-type biogenesis protein CcmH/NrfF
MNGRPGTLSRRCRRVLVAAALLLGVALPAGAAPAVDVAADPALELRVNRVSAELRCLVCQNQTIADSNAALAVDLRNQVREQLRAGRSEQQVIDFMTARYGDFVRYRPPLRAGTLALWGGPAALLLGGLLLWWRGLRRPAPPPRLPAEEAERAERLLRPDGG